MKKIIEFIANFVAINQKMFSNLFKKA